MPSGKTHDRITWWSTPWVALISKLVTQHWGYTLLVVGGFLFGGLMFGPDLDIWSVQSRRWGGLRWLWRPYRGSLRHRSWLSHGILAGTLVRLVYLSLWAGVGLLLLLELTNTAGQTQVTWNDLGAALQQILLEHWRIWLAIVIGIELGAISHIVSDQLVSTWKRQQRRSSGQSLTGRQRRRRRQRKKKR